MNLPSVHQLLRRSFLRLVFVIGVVVITLFSIGTVALINQMETPTQNARLLSSIAMHEDTLRPMLANADPGLLKAVLAILRDSAFVTLARFGGDARSGELVGYGFSLQLLQNTPPDLVEWIDDGLRYNSATLSRIGPVPRHWREALRGRTRSIIFTEPEHSPLLRGSLADSGLETLLIPITDRRAVAVMSPTRALGHWYGIGSFGWTLLIGAALVTMALLLPAMLLAGLVVRMDSGRIEQPMAEVAAVAERYLRGDFDARVVDPGGMRETEVLGRVLNDLGERLARTLGDLEQRNQALDGLLKAQQQLFADVSHDLRTPLAALLINAELGQSLHPSSRELEVVVSEAMNLRRLVGDIFSIARLGSGQLRLETQSLDAAALVEGVVVASHAAAEFRGIKVASSIAEGYSPVVLADPHRLGQILRNLIGNAIRHTSQDGQINVIVERTVNASLVLFSVTDTGEGITEEDLPKVFDRFWRGESSRLSIDGERPSGLGLSIVKMLVEAMGGSVGIESAIGKGTRVWFTLPSASVDVSA
ncbi:ATP-binding protein [Silanimonas sp.]|jgi:two-component system sensor histidine kinase BaeS|uniref:sensor histidine kinase n=1 Tax=Silanimonas sp. TaxID=1929290 RepID=UPI0037C963E9